MGFLFIYILLQDGAEASYQFVSTGPPSWQVGGLVQRVRHQFQELQRRHRVCKDVAGFSQAKVAEKWGFWIYFLGLIWDFSSQNWEFQMFWVSFEMF